MAASELIGNLGYIAFITEATPGTPLVPTVFGIFTDETMTTNYNHEDQEPIFGNPAQTFQVLPGLRDHKGDITMIAEPNTAAHVVDMLLTRGSVTGSDPYTWPFTVSAATPPKSKTVDISTGNVVKRFVGVQASKLALSQSKNQLMLKVSVSALGSFQGGVITSQSGSGPYTIVFDTTYDTNLTGKLVVGDLVRFYDVGTTASVCDATVASITNGSTITITVVSGAMTAVGAGDIMHLRPQTPSFSLSQMPFLWSNTQFCFGATAAAALSAAQTRLEQGSTWEFDYGFESDSGSQRSGSADPASLIRMLAKPNLSIKKFFNQPDDVINFNQLNKTACVVRHFAVSNGKTYELRVTFNHLITTDPMPKIKSKGVNYADIKYATQYSQSDAQIGSITMLNGLPSLV